MGQTVVFAGFRVCLKLPTREEKIYYRQIDSGEGLMLVHGGIIFSKLYGAC
jgi:hypothetical protein